MHEELVDFIENMKEMRESLRKMDSFLDRYKTASEYRLKVKHLLKTHEMEYSVRLELSLFHTEMKMHMNPQIGKYGAKAFSTPLNTSH